MRPYVHRTGLLVIAATLLALASPPNSEGVAQTTAGAQQRTGLQQGDLDHLQWRNIGPGGVGGRIVDFAVEPANTDVIYAATAYSGVWKTVRSVSL